MHCSDCTWLHVADAGTSCADEGITAESTICSKFRSKEQDLVQITKAFEDAGKYKIFDWLPLNYSKAFMVTIGAGPWRFDRRQKVQQDALSWLGYRELEEIEGPVDCYPLEWQNRTVKTLSNSLRFRKTTMNNFCLEIFREAISDPAAAKRKFYTACGNPAGFKVLSLFCRDGLRIEAFPIDRHVSKRLKMYNLPVHENALVQLCEQAHLPVRDVATAFVQAGDGNRGLDTGNPDWSSK